VGKMLASVCLIVCLSVCPQRNSKMNDSKVFKLDIGMIVDITEIVTNIVTFKARKVSITECEAK